MIFEYQKIPENIKAKKILEYKKLPPAACKPYNLDNPNLYDELEELGLRMVKSCVESGGVGLAAPQVGIQKSMFLAIGFTKPHVWEFDKKFHMYINPTLKPIPKADSVPFPEGCLSVPGKRLSIIRPRTVGIHYWYFNEKKKLCQTEEVLEGHACRIVLHEFDHLNGINIVDLHERQNTKKKRGRKKKAK